jgi:hypothetical protein
MSDLVSNNNDTSWLTDIINSTANAYSTIKQADALNHAQLGTNGYYTNGQFSGGNAAGVSPMVWLLLGGALLVVVFLEK